MLASIVVFLFALGIATIIWNRNTKKKRFRERGWALFILAIGTVLILAQILRVSIPTPVDWIVKMTSPVYRPIMRWIEEDL
jgi:hypothetical protein